MHIWMTCQKPGINNAWITKEYESCHTKTDTDDNPNECNHTSI